MADVGGVSSSSGADNKKSENPDVKEANDCANRAEDASKEAESKSREAKHKSDEVKRNPTDENRRAARKAADEAAEASERSRRAADQAQRAAERARRNAERMGTADREQAAAEASRAAARASRAAASATQSPQTAQQAVTSIPPQVQAHAGGSAYDGTVPSGAGASGTGQPVPLTPMERDAQRVAAATAQSAENGARMLESLIAETPEKDRPALIKACEPSITRIAEKLHTDVLRQEDARGTQDRVVATLARIGELGGKEGAQALATAFAKGIPEGPRQGGSTVMQMLGSAMEKAVLDGHGAAFGMALTQAFVAAGKTHAAGSSYQSTWSGIEILRQRFDEATARVDGLNDDLGSALGPVGNALTPEQREAALKAFREKDGNAQVYASWEAAGAQLAKVMKAVGEQDPSRWSVEEKARAEHLATALPNVGKTQAGLEFLAEQLEKDGNDQPSFLEHVAEMGKTGKLTKEMSETLSTVLGKAAGMKAMAYAVAGDVKSSKALLAGLEKHAGLFGVERSGMRDLLSSITELRPNMTPDQLAAFGRKFEGKVNDLATTGVNPFHGGMQALRLIGIGFGAAYCYDGATKEKDFALRVQYIADGIGMGADVGLSVVDMAQHSARFMAKAGGVVNAAGTFMRFTGAWTGAISAVVDGISSMKALSEGKYWDAAASGQMAIGGMLVAAGTVLEGFPVAGTIAGAALLFGGLATSVIAEHVEEDRIKGIRSELLSAAQVDPQLAQTLVDADPARMNELGVTLGMSPGQIQDLARNYPLLLTMDHNQGLSMDGFNRMAKEFGLKGEQVHDLLRRVGQGEDGQHQVFVFVNNLLPTRINAPTSNRQEWLAALQREAQSGGDPGYQAAFQAAYDYLRQQR